MLHLPGRIPAIDHDIGPCGVRASITGQIHVGALELLGLGIPAQRNHTMPHLLDLLVHKVRETRVDVTGGNAVDAGKVPPFIRERFGQMDAARLGDVVRRLLLRIVGDVAGHAGSDDQGARFPLAEMQTDGSGAVKGSSQVGVDDFVPGLDAGVQDAGVGSPARVGDEDVNAAEILNHIVDQLLHVLVIAHVALVGFGFGTVFLLELLGVLDATFGTGGVGDCDVSAHLSTATGGFGADACGTGGAGHDDDFAFKAEELLEGVGFGGFDRHGGGWRVVVRLGLLFLFFV